MKYIIPKNIKKDAFIFLDKATNKKKTRQEKIVKIKFNKIKLFISQEVNNIPIAKTAEKLGNKRVHAISLLSMAVAYLLIACMPTKVTVLAAMGLAGVGWSSTLALPFAMLSKYIKEGTEGSAMGIFNIFISAPQVLVCTLLAWFINKSVLN